jgi:DNA-binding CsgD family transcriptional regulator
VSARRPVPSGEVDPVAILECAYRAEEADDDEKWLARILELARPALDEGLGAAGFFYDVSNPSEMRVWAPVLLGTPPGAIEALYTINASAPEDYAKELFRPTALCATLSERFHVGRRVLDEPLAREVLAPLGVVDFVSVSATDPTGVGCLIGAPLGRVAHVGRSSAALWNRIAAHIASGARLRRTKDAAIAFDRTHAAEAILSPSGKLEHAEDAAKSAEARDALATATRDMDRARGRLRRSDPDEAVGIWTALVAGRWALVDHFDHDGRRYVVARKNDPEVVPTASVLTPREQQVLAYAAMGQSNKLIGYTLGLSSSTVAMHLSSAAQKLGVKSRIALINAYRASS